MNTEPEREDRLTLELLDAVGENSEISQRHLARRMGVALGLANSYLKRCIRKGYVKIKDAPAHRYLYYLTPQGFSEKSRLTVKYLTYSFEFYRAAGHSCRAVYERAQANGWRRVLLCGVSDLAEIAALRAMEAEIEVVGVYDPAPGPAQFVGKPVWTALAAAAPYDACVLTDLRAPAELFQALTAQLDRGRVLVPDILRLA